MHQLDLTSEDNAAIVPRLARIAADVESIEDPALARRAPLLAHTVLPRHLVTGLEEYRFAEPSALCRISGLAIEDALLGDTPTHWRDSQFGSPSLPQEIFFLLCASVLGDTFGWATQQDGRLMHDVLPIKGHEHEEIGSNSLQHLSWHTEDSFHPCRGDYVALMCLRNPDAVETMVCTTADLDWSQIDVDALFESVFTQMPDNSHRPDPAAGSTGDATLDALRRRSFELIESWTADPVRRPVLFGDQRDPYMALDPYHMKTDGWPRRCAIAYEALCDQIEARMRGVALRPGDCVFIDNFKAVHGRRSFRPRYDGSDRWLKRLNVTRDFRGSRAWRPSADHRVIY
jgi:Fe(II)/alpha-ketoglutarate-dependent arginine beta-hydroxylase